MICPTTEGEYFCAMVWTGFADLPDVLLCRTRYFNFVIASQRVGALARRPVTGSAKQSKAAARIDGLLRFARKDGETFTPFL